MNAIKELIRHRDGTNPEMGKISAQMKDARAMSALLTASYIMRDLVGWAIDHHIGMAVADLKSIPYGLPRLKDNPIYIEGRRAVDTHEHEAVGVEVRDHGRRLTPEQRRRFLAQVLGYLNAGMPEPFTDELSNALEALELGEVHPLLERKRGGKKVNHTEYREQMHAIETVQFRFTSELMRKGEAQKEVAEAYGVDPETIRTWERRLREHFGGLAVAIRLERARTSGSYVLAMKKRDRSRAYSMLVDDERYGDKQLADSAARFKASLRDQKVKDPLSPAGGVSDEEHLRTNEKRLRKKRSDTKYR